MFNDDGDEDDTDGDGRRIEDEYGPARTATLDDGTVGSFRAHTAYTYDDEAPALGGGTKPSYDAGETSFDLVVERRTSASDVEMTVDHDPTVVRNQYAPVVAGDANGWELGVPTRVSTQLIDGAWSTQTFRYDTAGRQIEARQPEAATDGAGSGSDAQTTVFRYYEPNANDADCVASGAKVAWTGLLCKTGPAGQPAGTPVPVTWNKTYTEGFHPSEVVENSAWQGGSPLRTTTTSYDDLGRPVEVDVVATVATGDDVQSRRVSYDASSGAPVRVTGGGSEIVTAYDSWGRVKSYTDATGLTSVSTYTADGLLATFGDGVGTYSYAYDTSAGEHRRLPESVDTGDGVFALDYDAGGSVTSITYPNQMTARLTTDELGDPDTLVYADADGVELFGFTASRAADGKVVAHTSVASSQQYGYDELDRLTKVEDTRELGCTTRTYGYSAASERTSFTSYAPAPDQGCQSSDADVATTTTYDSANRIGNAGYSYDGLGRTLTLPAADTAPGGAGPLTAAYFATDMVKSLTQDIDDGTGVSTRRTSYGLDPTGRINELTSSTNGVESERLRYRYSTGTDVPTSIEVSRDGGATYALSTRYLQIPALGMVASVDASDAVTYQLTNLEGDVVATQAHTAGTAVIDSYTESDEFGRAVAPSGRYGWLGAHQRSSDTVGGLTLMGARLYNPMTGHFLSRDPVFGGNVTPYTYPTDPINQVDLSGEHYEAYYGGFKRYRVWGPDYVRVWLNRNAMRLLSTVAGTVSWSSTATGLIYGLLAAGAVSGGTSWVAAGLAAAIWGIVAFIAGSLRAAINYLRDRRRGLGFRFWTIRGVPTGTWYGYISSYAWGVGG